MTYEISYVLKSAKFVRVAQDEAHRDRIVEFLSNTPDVAILGVVAVPDPE